MLGKDQKSLAFTFFRPADVSDGKVSGQSFRKGTTGAPILIDVLGAVECRVISIVEQGDHHIVVGEVIDAHLNKPLTGRPDGAILEMKDSPGGSAPHLPQNWHGDLVASQSREDGWYEAIVVEQNGDMFKPRTSQIVMAITVGLLGLGETPSARRKANQSTPNLRGREKRDKVSCLQHFIAFGHWPV
jgi:hypothetical protein